MKRLLSTLLSISIALAPALSKASYNENSIQGIAPVELVRAQEVLMKNNVKIFLPGSNQPVTLNQAIIAGDFIVDSSASSMGIFRLKKVSATEDGKITIAISLLTNINQIDSKRVTSVVIDTHMTADENISRIISSLNNLANGNSKRTVASIVGAVAYLVIGLSFGFVAEYLATNVIGGRRVMAKQEILTKGIIGLGVAGLSLFYLNKAFAEARMD